MDIKAKIETVSKLISVLSDTCKFVVLAALAAFAIAAIAEPSWARQKLKDAGLSIKEINAFGVKLAADEAFDAAKSIADAKLTLTKLQTELVAQDTSNAKSISEAIVELDKAKSSLIKQTSSLKEVGEKAGLTAPELPPTGWIFVGRTSEDKTFTPGPRIDAQQTRVVANKVVALQIKSEAPVTSNGDECITLEAKDIRPPTEEQLQRMQVLISPNPTQGLQVVSTATCPSKGNGLWIYAQVKINASDVKFVKYESLLRR